ncbi:MAG: hypothetical protein KME47_05660 [Nodosilinea sp. WJT8-NPBG4]|jgi:hypothetical protein|nr:hypothetical protein [Nodosilinea sp. WJT8-NPBG4]
MGRFSADYALATAAIVDKSAHHYITDLSPNSPKMATLVNQVEQLPLKIAAQIVQNITFGFSNFYRKGCS